MEPDGREEPLPDAEVGTDAHDMEVDPIRGPSSADGFLPTGRDETRTDIEAEFFLPPSTPDRPTTEDLLRVLEAAADLMDLSPMASAVTSAKDHIVLVTEWCRFMLGHPETLSLWPMGYFSVIPPELQTHILTFVGAKYFISVRCVCRAWKALTEHPSIWQTLLEQEFSPVRNRLHACKFGKDDTWLYRSKKDIVGQWIGTYLNPCTGSLWEGEWKDGTIEGYGCCYQATKNNYFEGQWHKEHLSGYGRALTPAYEYEGDFKRTMRHGNGTCVWSKSDKGFVRYVGQWRNDAMDGAGEMRYVSGDTYSGEWLSGLKDGLGITEDSDGRKTTAIWEKGQCRVIFEASSESKDREDSTDKATCASDATEDASMAE